jgi:hypothetical protein
VKPPRVMMMRICQRQHELIGQVWPSHIKDHALFDIHTYTVDTINMYMRIVTRCIGLDAKGEGCPQEDHQIGITYASAKTFW